MKNCSEVGYHSRKIDKNCERQARTLTVWFMAWFTACQRFFHSGMEQQEIFALVKKCLVEEFEIPAEKIRPEASLFETLGLDSIDALDMIALLESRMNIEINEQELKKMRTVQHIVDYLKAHLPVPAL